VAIDVAGGISVTIEGETDDEGNPVPPVAGEPFVLTAEADGGDDFVYAWSRVSGAEVTFGDASAATTEATAAEAGEVVIRVEATDGAGRRAVAEITLTVLEAGGRPRVVMSIESETPGVSGDVVFELYSDLAPQTVENLLAYIDAGYFDGVLWHRAAVNADNSPFVVQTGAFVRQGDVLVEKEPLFDPVPGEPDNGVSNQAGTIAMALLNNDPDSGTSQFYVNLDDNSFLDAVFTVFGEVVEGMGIIDAMGAVETGSTQVEGQGSFTEVPVVDIVITSFRRAEATGGG